MQIPKFSRWVTIPVLFILNFLAWLYIYDDYMMGWIYVYPLFMIVAFLFTVFGELLLGKDRKFKYIGINICTVLLLLVLAQKYLPMEKIEQGLKENYYNYIKIDAPIEVNKDKGVRDNGVTIVARNFDENAKDPLERANKLEVYKEGKLIDSISLKEAVKKIYEVVPASKKAVFNDLLFYDVRYAGFKEKGGFFLLDFAKNYIHFGYKLKANENGFIWDKQNYDFSSLELTSNNEKMFDTETRKKLKKMLLKKEIEKLVELELEINNKGNAVSDLTQEGYNLLSEDPLRLKVPLYEIANISHKKYVDKISIVSK